MVRWIYSSFLGMALVSSPLLANSVDQNITNKIERTVPICNFARVVKLKNSIPVRDRPKQTGNIVGKVNVYMPIYTCDETEKWTEIRFKGECAKKNVGGLRVNATGGCSKGWVESRYLDILSG